MEKLSDLSPEALFASILVGGVGLALFLYGKKQSRPPQFVGGLLMLLSPYLVHSSAGLIATASVIGLGTWLAARAGY